MHLRVILGLALWGLVGCSDKADDLPGDSTPAGDDTGSGSGTGTGSGSGKDDTGTPPPQSDSPLLLNELLAINNTTNVDETKQYEDWLEIYNPDTAAIDVGGFQLTDKLGQETPWAIPAGNSVAAGGYLLVWCDSEGGDGPLHANFQLDGAAGERVVLLDGDGAIADDVTFGEQTADMSWARHPDGGETWQQSAPTPLAANP